MSCKQEIALMEYELNHPDTGICYGKWFVWFVVAGRILLKVGWNKK